VEVTRERTGWTVRRILKLLGVRRSRYYDWRRRQEEARLDDLATESRALHSILPEEKEAVVQYALDHPKDGYRRLCWQMIDEDVAYVSPSSVYRILLDEDLLYRWKRSSSRGERPPEPTKPNERWHTDIMYLRIQDTWYFLVNVLDAYSRYVVHWELLSTMRANDVRLVIQEALEKTGATPQIVTDNGSQFTAKDFKQLVRQFDLEHIRIRTYHPESNGRVERLHRSTREALGDEELHNLGRAREIIGRWVKHYNENRLHASLDYLPPEEYYAGAPAARIEERREKLEKGRKRRREKNEERLQAARIAGEV
jgi:putative transposase